MQMGFKIKDPQEILMWKMYKAYQAGISPYEFRKCNMDDLNTTFEIQKAVNEKLERERKTREAMARMR